VPLAPACCVGSPWIVTLDSERLRQARKWAGLSQERLAYAAGVSLTTVGSLERQARPRCHFRTRARLAAALGAHPKLITAVPDEAGTGAMLRAAGTGESVREAAYSRTFPARPDQVGQARGFVRRVLAGCPVADDALLVCSELAANAVQHSASARPGGRFTVRAWAREGDCTWIEVADQGGRWTARERSGEHGRGLVIVEAVADYWDIRGDDTGRAVRARIDWPRAA
jgi:serine/threonine-protein kinase RsbW